MILSLSGVGWAWANPSDRAVMAAMRLGEQRNYSWTSHVTDDARSYAIEGKTERGGCAWVRLPMVPAVAQRLGRDADVEIEAIFRGSTMAVIRTERGWRTLRELPRRRRDWSDTAVIWPVSRSAGPLWGAGGNALGEPGDLPPLVFPQIVHFKEDDDEDGRPYSNAQFGLAQPHEELAIIVSSYLEWTSTGDIVTGTLTDLGAQLLLVRDGQEHIEPVCAAGAFKLLLKNGVVVRYLIRLEGILVVDRKRVHTRQVSNTVISAIGTTRVTVPEEAQRKLGL